MKDDWERVKPVSDLPRAKVTEMVKGYFTGKKVVNAIQLGGGFSNSNYQIHIEGMDRPFLLRVYENANEVCQKERDIYKLVHRTVPVPEIYYLDQSCRIYEKPFAIVEWVEGVRLSDLLSMGNETDLAEAGVAVGSVLADIHSYSFDSPGFFGEGLKVETPLQMESEMFVTFMEDCLFHGRAGAWLGKEITDRLWHFTQGNAPLLAAADGFSLTHSDFNGWNLLMRRVTGKWKMAAVLDWEFAFSATSSVDIGNMLRYEGRGSLFEETFIEGFVSGGGNLPDNWRRRAKLEDLVALCDLLNRTESGKNRIADLKRLIVGTMDDFKA